MTFVSSLNTIGLTRKNPFWASLVHLWHAITMDLIRMWRRFAKDKMAVCTSLCGLVACIIHSALLPVFVALALYGMCTPVHHCLAECMDRIWEAARAKKDPSVLPVLMILGLIAIAMVLGVILCTPIIILSMLSGMLCVFLGAPKETDLQPLDSSEPIYEHVFEDAARVVIKTTFVGPPPRSQCWSEPTSRASFKLGVQGSQCWSEPTSRASLEQSFARGSRGGQCLDTCEKSVLVVLTRLFLLPFWPFGLIASMTHHVNNIHIRNLVVIHDMQKVVAQQGGGAPPGLIILLIVYLVWMLVLVFINCLFLVLGIMFAALFQRDWLHDLFKDPWFGMLSVAFLVLSGLEVAFEFFLLDIPDDGTSPVGDYLLAARAASGFVCLCVWTLTRVSSHEHHGDLDPRMFPLFSAAVRALVLKVKVAFWLLDMEWAEALMWVEFGQNVAFAAPTILLVLCQISRRSSTK